MIKKTVALDLDGVLAKYDGVWKGVDVIGEPFEGAQKFVQDILDMGHNVCVYTTRTNTEVNNPSETGQDHLTGERWQKRLTHNVAQWLIVNGFPPLEQGVFEVYDGGKPLAAAYVDDRAVQCIPSSDKMAAEAYSNALEDIRVLTAPADKVDKIADDIISHGGAEEPGEPQSTTISEVINNLTNMRNNYRCVLASVAEYFLSDIITSTGLNFWATTLEAVRSFDPKCAASVDELIKSLTTIDAVEAPTIDENKIDASEVVETGVSPACANVASEAPIQ